MVCHGVHRGVPHDTGQACGVPQYLEIRQIPDEKYDFLRSIVSPQQEGLPQNVAPKPMVATSSEYATLALTLTVTLTVTKPCQERQARRLQRARRVQRVQSLPWRTLNRSLMHRFGQKRFLRTPGVLWTLSPTQDPNTAFHARIENVSSMGLGLRTRI